jgi:hypothetical protein
MPKNSWRGILLFTLIFFALMDISYAKKRGNSHSKPFHPYAAEQIPAPGEKVIVIDPRAHSWGAYDEDGILIRSGLATAGASWCRDLRRPCRTKAGSFRIYSLGSSSCKSSKFPMPRGGAPMPYCMFFNGGQAIHGSARGNVVPGNESHGCVRVHVEDARWIRFEFAEGPSSRNGYRGTRVIVRPY